MIYMMRIDDLGMMRYLSRSKGDERRICRSKQHRDRHDDLILALWDGDDSWTAIAESTGYYKADISDIAEADSNKAADGKESGRNACDYSCFHVFHARFRLFLNTAEAPAALAVIYNCLIEVVGGEIRPKNIRKPEFRVRRLPDKEIWKTIFAARPDYRSGSGSPAVSRLSLIDFSVISCAFSSPASTFAARRLTALTISLRPP